MDNELLEPSEQLQRGCRTLCARLVPVEQGAIDTFDTLKSTDAAEVVQALQNREVLAVANNDEAVRSKLNSNARGIIETATDTIAKDTKLKNQHANFRVNKFACDIYGVDESCPLWQQRLMKIGAAFWFIIYWLFASITIVPVNTFLQMVGNIIRNNFCKWFMALLFYLAILGAVVVTPILVKLL